ncbi:MAG: hypothetical protein LKE30_00115 [Bacteroidales bacterium]|jgi:uncharacterized membrane protein (DUF106 family)|nr:hypothetical protein [Bacteroidales bacterium]
MNSITTAKILDYLSMIGIVIIVALYFFMKLTFKPLALLLLAVCIIKMFGAIIKANYYQKESKKLKDEAENYKNEVEVLKDELNKK